MRNAVVRTGAAPETEAEEAGAEATEDSGEDAAKTAAEDTGQEPAETETEDTGQDATETEDGEPVEIPIDFEALWEINPEAYAWITISGTEIDYPILQSETDNTYYLTHSIEGEESPEGAIFTEDYNSKDFEDPNTVIYGHNMRNGSMFQGLHEYMDRAFFDENREVLIYLPDKILHYEIFAAYLYDDRHLLESFDFEDEDVFGAYLNRIFSIRDMNSFIDTDMEVTAEDKIITLSTCYSNESNQRYLVQAVLVSIDE
ncbi:MAG TPA: class B sortase [Candidatus Limivivens intestinipullorum]|uniref:Class B sortase n=1 Tax=Candidatus Limivivens intestinipullorum TaxID=2840858 RepID=A0A9D1JK23_9FIRM|nr:class B sortase [Candidatus Limivivens intestinipullorum]